MGNRCDLKNINCNKINIDFLLSVSKFCANLICSGGICPGVICPGGKYPEGKSPGGKYPGDICPITVLVIISYYA